MDANSTIVETKVNNCICRGFYNCLALGAMGIGKQIRHYRDKAGWTLDDLCEASGVEPGTISALENRDSNSSRFFLPIAKAFGLTLEELADASVDHELRIAVPVEAAAIPLPAREPSKPYLWPFDNATITPDRYASLSKDERKGIENTILLFLKAREDPKHQAPANHIASA